MKNVNRRFISVLLVLTLIFMQLALFAGCKKSDSELSGKGISRSEWIMNLATATGTTEPESTSPYYSDVTSSDECFNSVQACTEWEVLDGKGNFNPNEATTYEFLAETCMKTIGLEKLSNSELNLGDVKEDDLVNIFSDKVADIKDPKAEVSELQAEVLLDEFITFSNALTYKPYSKVEYTSSVNTEVKSEDVAVLSSSTAMVSETAKAKVGDIIIVEPSADNPTGQALKVQSIDGQAITYTTPSVEEICEELIVQGTYDASITNIEGAGETEIIGTSYNSETGGWDIEFSNPLLLKDTPEIENTAKKKSNKQGAEITVSEDKNSASASISKGPATATFSVSKLKITPDVNIRWFPFKVKSASVKASVGSTIKGELNGEASIKDIKLFTFTVPINGTILSARIDVKASVGVDGELVVKLDSSITAEASYKSGAGPKFALTPKSTLDVDGHVNAYINVTPIVTLSVLNLKDGDIVNVSATVGGNALATISGDLLDTDEPTCINALLYVSAKLAVNKEGSTLTTGLFSTDKVIWNENTSQLKYEFHYEFNVANGTYGKVDSCTKGNSEKVEVPDTNSTTSDAVEEYFKDFKELEDGGALNVDFSTCEVKPGGTKAITVSDLPEGYSASDLVYKSGSSKIATVSADGVITGVSQGTTVVTVKTKDGKYSSNVKVTVSTEYANFNGLYVKPNTI